MHYIYKLQDDEPFEFKSARKKIASVLGGASKKLRDQVNSSQVVLAYQVNSSQVVLAFCRALSLNLHSLQPTQSANLANNNLGSRYRKEQKYGFGKSEKTAILQPIDTQSWNPERLPETADYHTRNWSQSTSI